RPLVFGGGGGGCRLHLGAVPVRGAGGEQQQIQQDEGKKGGQAHRFGGFLVGETGSWDNGPAPELRGWDVGLGHPPPPWGNGEITQRRPRLQPTGSAPSAWERPGAPPVQPLANTQPVRARRGGAPGPWVTITRAAPPPRRPRSIDHQHFAPPSF